MACDPAELITASFMPFLCSYIRIYVYMHTKTMSCLFSFSVCDWPRPQRTPTCQSVHTTHDETTIPCRKTSLNTSPHRLLSTSSHVLNSWRAYRAEPRLSQVLFNLQVPIKSWSYTSKLFHKIVRCRRRHFDCGLQTQSYKSCRFRLSKDMLSLIHIWRCRRRG